MSALLLFFTVDLRPRGRAVERQLARVLATEESEESEECDWWARGVLDLLLPKAEGGRLMKIEYGDLGGDLFPTVRQMEYMWTHKAHCGARMIVDIQCQGLRWPAYFA